MLSNAFSGFAIDKLGTRLEYSRCMAFWTTTGLVHAFAITPLQFGICRFMQGKELDDIDRITVWISQFGT